jgi:AraC-like DNA-binding protein
MLIMAQQARNFLAGSGTIMILADPRGVILQAEGDRVTLDAAADIQLMAGSDWSERSRGTNGIRAALAARGPVQIHASEHFCAGITAWTCSATIVRDPSDGEILGALSVAGHSSAFNRHLLALVAAVAGRIETTLASREMERRERLLEYGLGHLSKVASGGLIFFDRKGRLIKADARAELTLATIGAESNLNAHIRIDALDVDASKHASDLKLPEWLHPEWMEPVVEDSNRLGTIVVLPERFQRRAMLPEGGLPRYKLRRVMEFIEAHIDQTIGLEHLASVAGVSPFHFHRQFKRSTGSTPHQYIVQMRIERAKALLSQSELPVVEVAARVGFTDQSHFTNTFRRVTSMTPRSYRNVTLDLIAATEQTAMESGGRAGGVLPQGNDAGDRPGSR